MYYGCENNPTCDFMTWDEPLKTKCPECGKSLFKRRAGYTVCLNEKCGYEKKETASAKKTTSGTKKTASKTAAKSNAAEAKKTVEKIPNEPEKEN